jgi:hypothetical protein
MRIDNPIGINAALTGSFSGSFFGNGSGLTNVAASNVEYANVLNKPTLLSGSAQIASQISGSFGAVSASFATRFDNLGTGFATDSELSNVSSSLAGDITNIYNTYATDTELANVSSSLAGNVATIFNTYATDSELAAVSASLASNIANIYSTYATDTELTNVSSSLASNIANIYNTYATDSELAVVSASLASNIVSINNTINGLDNTYATDSQLAALSASLIAVDADIHSDITILSSSLSSNIIGVNTHLNTVSGSLANRIDNINTAINNLDNTYATDASLISVSSSFASTTSTNVQIARINSGSFATRIDNINTTINNLGSTYATDSELASVSSSFASRIVPIESSTSTATSVNNTQNTRLAALEAATGSYQSGLTFNDTSGQAGINFTNTSGTITAVATGLGTTDNVTFRNGTFNGSVFVDGNLFVSGTTTSISVQNLAVSDNLIYLNNGAQTTILDINGDGTTITYTTEENHNYVVGMVVTVTGVNPTAYNVTSQTITAVGTKSHAGQTHTTFSISGSTTTSYVSGGIARAKSGTNPDLGFAGGYNDGTYHHAGLFRDASDNIWKFFRGYDPEPDASIYIDTTHASFELAPLQVSNLIATSITGSLSGNASTASKLATARTITLGGDLTGNVSFDGSAGVTLTATIAADSVALGTDTTGNYVASLVAGTGITLANNTGEGATPTITNSAPDQTVVLTAGSNVTITGTYPSFTIASTDTNTTYTASTGLSLTGTAFSIDSSVVTLSGAQILTNKTINASQLVDASVTNAKLANSSVTVTAGTGMSGGGAVSLGSSVTLTNAGVTSNVAGTGISVSGATGAVTITNSDRGSSQNIFKNIAVAGQTTVVADTNDDTLTLAAGSNVTITTDATTDTITITATDTNTTYSAGTGITLTGTTFSNAGVTSAVAGTGVGVSAATGAVTFSIGQSVATSAQVTFDSVITGNNGNGTNVRIGDDAWIGDINAANTFRIQGVQDATQGYIVFGNSNATALGRTGTGALTYGGNTIYHGGNLTVGDGGLTQVNFTTTRRDKLDGIAANANNYSLPTATSTALGGIELASDTTQTVAANAVSATAGRTYGLQLNASLQGVVNVPWTDTTYSVGDGGLTAVNFTTTRRDKLDGIAAGATNVTNTNQLTNGAGYITASSTDTLTNKSGNISQWTNNSGYQTSSGTVAKVENTVTSTNSADLVYGNMADNDQFRIRIGGTASNAGFVEIATADDATEPIHVRQYSGVFTTLSRTATLLDGSGNTTFPGDVTAYSSDERLKENIKNIPNALDKVLSLNGVTFDWKQEAFDAGFNPKIKEGDAGVLAQQVQAVLPQAVKPAPFDLDENGGSRSGENYLTVQYEKLAPLFIEAIKEQQKQIEELKAELAELKNK